MSDDDLMVSSSGVGGAARVATEAIAAEASVLGAAAYRIDDWRERLRVTMLGLEASGIRDATEYGTDSFGIPLAHARDGLDRLLAELADLRTSLTEAAARYGDTEARISAMGDLGARVAAYTAGLAWPLWLPGAIIGRHLFAGWRTFDRRGADAAFARVLRDPMVLRALHSAGGSVDEFFAGLRGVPLPIALMVGAKRGAPENARALLDAAALAGLLGSSYLREGPVTVRQAPTPQSALPPAGRASAVAGRPTPPPAGVGELARRVPSPDEVGDPQIAVERYEVDGRPRWIVYIGGTVDFTIDPGEQALDGTNDLASVAESSRFDPSALIPVDSAAASRAVRDALLAAGADPADPVLPIGFSAGGITAAGLVEDPEWHTVAGVSLGAPVSQVDVGATPFLEVAHSDDLVPTVGGGTAADDRIRVSARGVFDETEFDRPAAAHDLKLYQATAARVDGLDDPKVQEFEQLVQEFTGGARGVRTEWVASRDE
ncbi:hypothetical protein FLP10_09180 [Agromyces intestinalis]|uniref:Alpha/beta hydrolase n=1 Tax=Agromyces intestinalis TaxID=2592652 RepID=A0A5C1YEV3_9MICO|nr:hypothetical protein [Agromyces intestinalis]QEO14574.1 hypothetical protein FLP10_09180 [Agromyces intestinalis]